uniref:Uncharacterized protein n=1 Tax=Rhizophora mucronata TaxID=61149 RepID=A0A2P2LZA8_RHIMU
MEIYSSIYLSIYASLSISFSLSFSENMNVIVCDDIIAMLVDVNESILVMSICCLFHSLFTLN